MQVTLPTQDPGNCLGTSLPPWATGDLSSSLSGPAFSASAHSGEGGKGGGNGWVNTDGDHQEVRGGGGWDHGKVHIDRKSGQSAEDWGRWLMVIAHGTGEEGHHEKYGK